MSISVVAATLPIMDGKIKRYFKVHICEHLEISHLTGKKVKIDEKQYKITFTVTTFLSFLKTFLF